MHRLAIPIFVIILAMVVPLMAPGQSDATCIAYMEADANYKLAKKAAIRAATDEAAGAELAEAERAEAARDIAQAAYDTAPNESRAAVLEKAKDTLRDARLAWLAAHKSAVLDKGGILEQAMDGRIVPESARQQRVRAYLEAYQGPKSVVASVMAKLVEADRERCRERFER